MSTNNRNEHFIFSYNIQTIYNLQYNYYKINFMNNKLLRNDD